MKLIEHIEQIFTEHAEKTGEKRSRIIINTGIDPAQYRAYQKANRLLSDDMLQRIANTYPQTTTLEELRARKALEQYGSTVISVACKIAKKETMPYADIN